MLNKLQSQLYFHLILSLLLLCRFETSFDVFQRLASIFFYLLKSISVDFQHLWLIHSLFPTGLRLSSFPPLYRLPVYYLLRESCFRLAFYLSIPHELFLYDAIYYGSFNTHYFPSYNRLPFTKVSCITNFLLFVICLLHRIPLIQNIAFLVVLLSFLFLCLN